MGAWDRDHLAGAGGCCPVPALRQVDVRWISWHSGGTVAEYLADCLDGVRFVVSGCTRYRSWKVVMYPMVACQELVAHEPLALWLGIAEVAPFPMRVARQAAGQGISMDQDLNML